MIQNDSQSVNRWFRNQVEHLYIGDHGYIIMVYYYWSCAQSHLWIKVWLDFKFIVFDFDRIILCIQTVLKWDLNQFNWVYQAGDNHCSDDWNRSRYISLTHEYGIYKTPAIQLTLFELKPFSASQLPYYFIFSL